MQTETAPLTALKFKEIVENGKMNDSYLFTKNPAFTIHHQKT
jgi:hypothetical protein